MKTKIMLIDYELDLDNADDFWWLGCRGYHGGVGGDTAPNYQIVIY